MDKIKNKILVTVVFCFLLIQPLVLAEGQRNLALHKKLDYALKPEYPLTVHPSDPFKLTDGIKDESLWYEKYREKTVGWYPVVLVEITVDLGQICNVGTVNIYTVGGGQSGVEYSEYAIAASSIDGNRYGFSSFASSDGWEFGTDKAIPKIIVLPVEQKARYVKLYVRPTGVSFFSDEIEVLESQNTELEDSRKGYLSKDQMIDLVERARQLQRDSDALFERIAQSQHKIDDFENSLQLIKKTILQLNRNLSDISVSKAESGFVKFRAKWLQSEYKTEWLCYPVEPMDILRYGALPRNISDDFQISLYQWKNEYGVATINLVNGSMAPINFSVHFSPLQMLDKTIVSAGIFELRRALYVRVLNAGLVADPLVLQDSKPFPVAPGETVQLWAEAYSKGLDAGTYVAALAINASGENVAKTRQTIPIQLDIADKTFPDELPFYSCNWDYITISDRFTSKNLNTIKQAAIDLENHYINVVTIRPDRMYDENKLNPISYKMQHELAIRGDIKPFVLLLLGGKMPLEKRFGAFRTPNWEADFNYFLKHLRDFMLDKGFNYDSFAIYLFDEDIGDDFVYVAQMIRNFDPRLKIYANKWIEPGELNKVKNLIDIWCPHIPDVLSNKTVYDRYKNMKIFDQIWCYHANIACERFFAPTKTRTSKEWRGDNKIFWRTMPITAVSLDMTGAGFWVYQDANRTGWIKDKIGEHGVIYDGSQNPDGNCFAEQIIPSKRWQMWREGIEDAVALKEHPDLLKEFMAKSPNEITSKYLQDLRKRADKRDVIVD